MKPILIIFLFMVFMPWAIDAQNAMGLTELYNLAEQESRQIKVSKIGLDAASEAVESAKSALLPKLTLGLSESYIGSALLMSRGFSAGGTTDVIVPGLGPQKVDNGFQDNPHWGNTFSAQAVQVIYSGGAISSGIRMAELGKEMAELDVEKDRQDVRFLITGYYLDLYKIRNQIDVLEKNIELTKKTMENMEAKKEQGMVLKRDITRYELQLKDLQLAKVKMEDALSIINFQMVNTLHLPDDFVVVPDMKALDEECADLSNTASKEIWQEIGYENNIGIRQSEVASQMAEQRVRQAKSDALPKVALIAEDNFFGPYTNDLIPVNANVNTWFLGVGVKYDLSNLWTNKHKVNKAVVDLQQSHEKVELVRESVQNGIHACFIEFTTAFKEVIVKETQVKLSDENYSVVLKRYNNGLALLTDMLDASSTKLSADMDLVNARLAMLYAFYKLKYATSTL